MREYKPSEQSTKEIDRKRLRGFTIVELLIVVVVIAILAAITIVAYNGITNQANDTVVQSNLREVGQRIMTARLETDDYPRGYTAMSELKLAVSTNAYGVLFTQGSVEYNFLYCSPTNLDRIALLARSKSGRIFKFAEGRVSQYEGYGGGSADYCASLSVPIPVADDINRQLLYEGAWKNYLRMT